MTYCLAWKSASSIFAIADSAWTRHGVGTPPAEEFTTFGERHVVDPENGIAVFQGAAKISELSATIVYMCAGDVRLGDSFARAMRNALRDGRSVREAFHTAWISHTPFTDRNISPIICISDAGKQEILTPVDIQRLSSLQTAEIKDVGSMPARMLTLARLIAKYTDTPLLTEVEKLVCSTAIFQSLSVHEYLLEDGVGGVYQSVVLNNSALIRSPSCYYIMVEDALADGIDDQIFVYMLKNAILTRSKQNAFTKTLLFNSLQLDDSWQTVQFPEIGNLDEINAYHTDYVVVFRKSYNRILILENKSHNGPNQDAFTVTDRKPRVAINPVCEKIFNAPRNPKAAIEISFLRAKSEQGYWTVNIGIPWEE